ncbi:hypothetical protein B566_EDAN008052 [Ephemera danica]|nr:hypothetical protein B566_EDAN008052 [Ephemera danica]
MTSNNAPQLPVEIFEIILSHLDGMTFARACFVCKSWKAISERLSLKPSRVWQNICRKELRLEDLAEIIQQWYPAARMETYWTDQQIDWQEIFKFSQVWKLTSSCIVTGHDDGTVRIWSQDGVFLECLANHEGLVTDLELISFHLWHMVAPKDSNSMPTVFNIAHIQEHSLALSLWSNRNLSAIPQLIVTGITPKGCHLEVQMCPEHPRNSPLFWSRSVGSVPQVMPNNLWDGSTTKLNAEGIMKCYVWRQDLFVIITGAVALFYFEDPKELLTLDLEHPSRLLQMSGDPISYLAISVAPENTTLLAVAEESMNLCYLA